jgi:O-antigen/teichoic acid export membrane protein
MNDFTKNLPVFTLSSFFNYFTQWGVILLVTSNFNNDFSSEFILVLRVCVVFNVVMSLINSFDASKMFYIYKENGRDKLQEYINKYKKVYFFSGLLVFVFLACSVILLKSVANIKPLEFEMTIFLLVSFSFAFNLLTGPASHCLAMLGNEKILMYIRLIFSCILIIGSLLCNEENYSILFALYIILQKTCIMYVLNKKHGIKTAYYI